MEVSEEAVKAAKDVLYYANPNDVERALTAAAPHLAAVQVKKLEWVDVPGEWRCKAKSDYCTYDIEFCPERENPWELSAQNVMGGYFDTLEAAKAAAQADYEARILSALETSAARELALEDRARLDAATAALISLTEAGIPTDVQELLIVGDPSRGIAPGSLSKAIATVLRALSSPDHADAGKVEGDGCVRPSVKGVIPTKFGECICFSGIDDARLILVSVCGQSGLTPVKYLLPHQLYVHDVQKLSEQGEVLVSAVPVYDQQINVTSALPSEPASEGAK